MRCPRCEKEMSFEPEGWVCNNKSHGELTFSKEVMCARREAAGEIFSLIMMDQLSVPDQLLTFIRKRFSL